MLPFWIPLALWGASTGFSIAGNFYTAQKQNELYSKKLQDMQSWLYDYRKQHHLEHRRLAHPYMGYPGQMKQLQNSIDINNTMPWYRAGSSLASFGAGATGAYNAYTRGFHKGYTTRWLG